MDFWTAAVIVACLVVAYHFREPILRVAGRALFFRRVRKAERIEQALELARKGETERAFAELERIGQRLPRSLGSVYFNARGHVLELLDRIEEAEQAFTVAVMFQDGGTASHLRLALLCAKQKRFEDGQAWLDALDGAKNLSDDLRERSADVRSLIEKMAASSEGRQSR